MESSSVIEKLKEENKKLREEVDMLKQELYFYKHNKVSRDTVPSISVALSNLENTQFEIAMRTSFKLRGMMNLLMGQLYPQLDISAESTNRIQVILDIMETMTSGAVKMQQILIGVLLYSCSVPRVVWNLLCKLRIAPTEFTIKKWLKGIAADSTAVLSMKVYGIDTTYMTSYHSIKSAQIHPVTICVSNVSGIKWQVSDSTFKLISEEQLKMAVCQSFKAKSEYQNWFLIIQERHRNRLKLSFPTSTALTPDKYRFPHVSRFKYGMDSKKATPFGNVEDLILDLVKEHCQGDNNQPLFLYGDYEYYSKIVRLSVKEKRLIPVLAVWHYIWHVVKAIFIIHGDWLLIPIAQRFRYRKIKLEANNFHASCGFIVTITKVALHLISKFKLKTDVTQHFNECKYAAVMYSELVNFVYSAGIPLCMLLTAVRSGNFELFRKCVISNLRLFLVSKKHHYSFLSVHFIWVTGKLQQKALQIYISNMWFPLSQNSVFYSGNDVIIENVC